MKLFCFGFGYTASYFAKSAQWDDVYGTHRGDFPLDAAAQEKLAGATHILVSIPPDVEGDLVLRRNYKMNPQWVGYLSTTGVYGNTNGEWVNEESPLNPNNDRSAWRVLAENQWRESLLPVNIFRLSGIYGPTPPSTPPNRGEERGVRISHNAIDELKAGTARRIQKENQFFSRIHVEDIAQILVRSLNVKNEIFNCADDFPCAAAEVVEYAAKLLGISPPPLIAFEKAELSAMARSFYSSSRRVKNDKIKQKLGVQLIYPNYKEGLASCLA